MFKHKKAIQEVFNCLYKAIYNENAAGGSLHIILDDLNVYDEALEFCAGYSQDYASNPQINAINQTALICLNPFSESKRIKMIRNAENEYNKNRINVGSSGIIITRLSKEELKLK